MQLALAFRDQSALSRAARSASAEQRRHISDEVVRSFNGFWRANRVDLPMSGRELRGRVPASL